MSEEYDLICVIPVYNEELVLPQAIPLIVASLKAMYTNWRFLVVIANNGSTDQTATFSEQLAKDYAPCVRHVDIAQKGRGQAFRRVFGGAVRAKRYLYIDVDLPCELDDLRAVLAPLDLGADLVISRRTGYRPLGRRLMTLGLRSLNWLMFGVHVSDSQCAVKALSPRAVGVMMHDCQQSGWYLDTELVILSRQRGLIVTEVPIRWIEQRFAGRASKVHIAADILDCLRSLVQIRKRRADISRLPSPAKLSS